MKQRRRLAGQTVETFGQMFGRKTGTIVRIKGKDALARFEGRRVFSGERFEYDVLLPLYLEGLHWRIVSRGVSPGFERMEEQK